MENLSLFGPEETSSGFDRKRLAHTLTSLAGDRILIGTSSWRYEGWLGQIYTPDKYSFRGRFLKKRFEQDCLREYAEVFPIVCGDFSFYQFPTEQFWHSLFEPVPQALKFAFKVPEEVTCRTFPTHPRYGPKAGELNQTFLNSAVFQAGFLDPLTPYRDRIAVLIFEFGTFSKKSYAGVEEFLADLDPFLQSLPGGWKYAVEIRNEEFLGGAYFNLLRTRGVAHVFNSWARMPPLHKQVAMPGAFTADFVVTRGLLRVGRPYETAVKLFAPYEDIQDPYPEARETIRRIIEHSRKRKQAAYLFINNRLEGNAPKTIDAIVHEDD